MFDSIRVRTPVTKNYYYDDNQRVLVETDDSEVKQRYFVFGQYIDDVLMIVDVAGKKCT